MLRQQIDNVNWPATVTCLTTIENVVASICRYSSLANTEAALVVTAAAAPSLRRPIKKTWSRRHATLFGWLKWTSEPS